MSRLDFTISIISVDLLILLMSQLFSLIIPLKTLKNMKYSQIVSYHFFENCVTVASLSNDESVETTLVSTFIHK